MHLVVLRLRPRRISIGRPGPADVRTRRDLSGSEPTIGTATDVSEMLEASTTRSGARVG